MALISPRFFALSPAWSGVSRIVVGGAITSIAIGAITMQLWTPERTQPQEAAPPAPAESNEPIQPIVSIFHLDRDKIDLGRKLLNEPMLSHNNQLSCSSCHDLSLGGTDRKARSRGINGAVSVINAPTVFNSGFNFSQFWDGRADTLERQVGEPLQSKTEMGSTWSVEQIYFSVGTV